MGMKYKNIDGSIFRGDKQLLVVVSVECTPALRNRICDTLITILNKQKPSDRKPPGNRASHRNRSRSGPVPA